MTGAGPSDLAFDFPSQVVGRSLIVNADAFVWLARLSESSLHAIVTDPPYGVKEFEDDQITKRSSGRGGVWRIPPSFDGHERSPLPRFTALNARERAALRDFFAEWSRLAVLALRPGGHVFLASNAFLSQLVFSALVDGGLEYRGQIIRLVRTLRGGDRPKNAEREFPDVSSLPRGQHEPWGLFRRPLPRGMTVGQSLRLHQTGALRRTPDGLPFVTRRHVTPLRTRRHVTPPDATRSFPPCAGPRYDLLISRFGPTSRRPPHAARRPRRDPSGCDRSPPPRPDAGPDRPRTRHPLRYRPRPLARLP